MLAKGFKSISMIPGMTQHIGASCSSFRDKVGVISEDFI
jgi:hypothetical protein